MLSNDFLPIPVLVLHIRRGDFQEHCRNLAEWSASYTGFNSFPEFRVRDKFDVPRITGHQAKKEADAFFEVPSMDERKAIYARHCYPDIPQIVKRVRDVVHDYNKFILRARGSKATNGVGNAALTRLYIMTNGDRAWLEEVKGALLRDAKLSRSSTSTEWQFGWAWENASTSRDLHLGWEEKGVAQALDMYLAQRAELFVGNGVSGHRKF
ncbi:hypothetical protein M413DRAFT_432174 [Hebeloma cylindrosporum]|uniref:Uncharacterized protein n=1 Tax=Hebeloma cylindrosporum TaxID=76867 RepID=A0A0C3CKV6_HEBCY|nr:hypothetical protein M413DRAFT_432174 [Hebeloma cylindrosporum h7]